MVGDPNHLGFIRGMRRDSVDNGTRIQPLAHRLSTQARRTHRSTRSKRRACTYPAPRPSIKSDNHAIATTGDSLIRSS